MKRIPLVMLMIFGMSSYVFADWELLNDESSLHYVSIKDASTGEINSFKTLQGSVSASGAVSLNVDLTSVETHVPIRNERMQEMFFEVAKFAQAHISGDVDIARVAELEVGESYTETITLALSLHGVSSDVTSGVQVIKLSNEKVLVTSLEPVLVNAEAYKLAEGIEKLREVAKLPSISLLVPVTYSLVFKQ